MTRKHVKLVLEKFLIGEEIEYTIDENYINYYKDNLILTNENESLLREIIGAEINNIFTALGEPLSIRAHIKFKDKLYSFLAEFDRDVDVLLLSEVDEVIWDICRINLPYFEKEKLKTLSL
jgi:hypothetical protein